MGPHFQIYPETDSIAKYADKQNLQQSQKLETPVVQVDTQKITKLFPFFGLNPWSLNSRIFRMKTSQQLKEQMEPTLKKLEKNLRVLRLPEPVCAMEQISAKI